MLRNARVSGYQPYRTLPWRFGEIGRVGYIVVLLGVDDIWYAVDDDMSPRDTYHYKTPPLRERFHARRQNLSVSYKNFMWVIKHVASQPTATLSLPVDNYPPPQTW